MIDTSKLPGDCEVWTSGDVTLINGDCLAVLPAISGVDAVVTSPPYAMQRASQYGGIPEHRYPLWTANWMIAIEPGLSERASVLIKIREHIEQGEISDYVHKTRLLLRDVGFVECEEIIWCKPDSAPVGSTKRPRRSWERVLWFGKSGDAYCDPKANGSEQADLEVGLNGRASEPWSVAGKSAFKGQGKSRHRDYIEVRLSDNTAGVDHPARYPTPLAEWLVNGWAMPGSTVLDPFTGSGTTGVACVNLGRKFIGVEISKDYFEIAKTRIAAAQAAKAELLIA